jgi:hypothetical protein
MIKYISDKNGVSRADIEKYLKDGIAAVVDEKFRDVTITAGRKTEIKQALAAVLPKPESNNL